MFLYSYIGRTIASSSTVKQFTRHYAIRKRFYRKTGILFSSSQFEITLDQRKLKTPKGNLFVVDNEALALAVASEWDAQKENIVPTSMHISTLCNTAIDNPNNLNKFDIAQYIINYLDTDTLLFQSGEDDELYNLQVKEWDPVIQWFCDRFQINLQKSRDINGPIIPEQVKGVISKFLMSYNFASLNGFVYGVDTLKSVILTIACAEKYITVEKATLLSRLEEEFQIGHWGRVEWAHDLSQQELQSRLAATMLFIYFNSTSSKFQQKGSIAGTT